MYVFKIYAHRRSAKRNKEKKRKNHHRRKLKSIHAKCAPKEHDYMNGKKSREDSEGREIGKKENAQKYKKN